MTTSTRGPRMDSGTGQQIPSVGALVAVRGRKWVVGDVEQAAGSTCVTLQSVEDGEYGRTLDVIWEVEPGRLVLPSGSLPEVAERGFDPPERLAAFLDAVRWSAVTSADVKTLQAPFRSGVAIEDYQLEPVSRAVGAPRVNLLLADDVGLGKTIEAGLVAQELLLRHRARRIMIICPAGLTVKWHDEMAEKFGLEFTVVDSQRCAQVRRDFGSAANPFAVFPLTIVSLPWLRGPKAQRLLDEVLPPDAHGDAARAFDLLILDEAHHVAPAAPHQVYAVDSQQTKLIRRLAPHFTHRLFLSATPHNGYQASFTACWRSSTTSASPGRGPGPRGRQADGRPPAQARHRERRRHAPLRRAAHLDDRRRVPRERTRGPPAARRVHRPAPGPHHPPDRSQGRRPGHAAAQEAAVLQPGRLRAHRRRLPGDPGTAVRPARAPAAGRGRRVARRVPRRRRTGRRRDPAPDRGRRPRPGHPAAVRRTPHRRRPGDRCAAQHGGVGARPRGPGRREGPRADHLPPGCLPAGPALDERARGRVHRVPRHAALARRAAAPGGHGRPARRAAARRHRRRRARAAAAGVPGRPDRAPGPHPAGHRRRQRGHRPAAPLPPPGQLRHPVQPEPAGAADRPHRPLRPGDRSRHPPLRRHRLGPRRRRLRGGPGVPRPGGAEGRHDARRPRLGERGARRRRAAADGG